MNEWLLDAGPWVLTWVFLLVGLVGTVVPVLPGQVLILLAALSHWWFFRPDSHLGWWTFLVMGLMFAVAQLMETLSGAVGSKYFGGSKWGITGALVGGFLGLFFFPWGLIVGPLAGASLCEYFLGKKEIGEATRSGVGSALGTLSGMVAKLGIAVLMAAYLVADMFWV